MYLVDWYSYTVDLAGPPRKAGFPHMAAGVLVPFEWHIDARVLFWFLVFLRFRALPYGWVRIPLFDRRMREGGEGREGGATLRP